MVTCARLFVPNNESKKKPTSHTPTTPTTHIGTSARGCHGSTEVLVHLASSTNLRFA